MLRQLQSQPVLSISARLQHPPLNDTRTSTRSGARGPRHASAAVGRRTADGCGGHRPPRSAARPRGPALPAGGRPPLTPGGTLPAERTPPACSERARSGAAFSGRQRTGCCSLSPTPALSHLPQIAHCFLLRTNCPGRETESVPVPSCLERRASGGSERPTAVGGGRPEEASDISAAGHQRPAPENPAGGCVSVTAS